MIRKSKKTWRFNKMTKTMKKMFALAVLAIFMLSILPVALAEEETGTGVEDVPAVDGTEDVLEEPVKGKENKVPPKKQVNIKQKSKKFLEETKEKIRNNRERYNKLKEKQKEAKQFVEKHRERLNELKGKVNKCEGDDCKEFKKNLKVGVKNHLVKTSDLIARSVEKLLDRIENSNVMTDEEKEEALVKVRALEEKLSAKKDEIEAMADEATAAEIRGKIKELKDLWNEIRKEQRWIITQLINNKMGNLADKHDEFYNSMQMRISNLKEKGATDEQLEKVRTIAEEFKVAVDKLKADQEAADAAWENSKVSKERLEDAKEKQIVVRKDLRETKELLREFVKEFKSIEVDEVDEEVEDVEESEVGEAEEEEAEEDETVEEESTEEETTGEE